MEINDLRKLKAPFSPRRAKLHEVETEPDGRKSTNLRHFHSLADKVSTFSLLPSSFNSPPVCKMSKNRRLSAARIHATTNKWKRK